MKTYLCCFTVLFHNVFFISILVFLFPFQTIANQNLRRSRRRPQDRDDNIKTYWI